MVVLCGVRCRGGVFLAQDSAFYESPPERLVAGGTQEEVVGPRCPGHSINPVSGACFAALLSLCSECSVLGGGEQTVQGNGCLEKAREARGGTARV